MTIPLVLGDDFAIETYSGLRDFLTEHLQLDSATVEELPTLIRLAEYRLNRLILAPDRETTTTLTTTAATQAVTLPTDCRQSKQLKISGDQTTGYPLEPVTLNVVEGYDYPGKPVAYAIMGNSALLGPIPDAEYSLTLTYIARLAPLSDASPSNWLLAGNADAYVYMASALACQHLRDLDAAALYLSAASDVIEEVNRQGVRFRNTAPIRLRSPVVV